MVTNWDEQLGRASCFWQHECDVSGAVAASGLSLCTVLFVSVRRARGRRRSFWVRCVVFDMESKIVKMGGISRFVCIV